MELICIDDIHGYIFNFPGTPNPVETRTCTLPGIPHLLQSVCIYDALIYTSTLTATLHSLESA